VEGEAGPNSTGTTATLLKIGFAEKIGKRFQEIFCTKMLFANYVSAILTFSTFAIAKSEIS